MKRILLPILLICALLFSGILLSGCVSGDYDNALTMMENGDFSGAKAILELHPDYKDTPDLLALCELELEYAQAEQMFSEEEYEEALRLYNMLGSFRSAKEQALLCTKYLKYEEAVSLADAGMWREAVDAFAALGGFLDSETGLLLCQSELVLSDAEDIILSARAAGESGDAYGMYSRALELLSAVPDLPAARERAADMQIECNYNQSVILLRTRARQPGSNGDFLPLANQFASYGDYAEAPQLAAVLNALSLRDASSFSDAMIGFEAEISAAVDPRDLYERFFDWTPGLDESLALLELYYRYEGSDADETLMEIGPEFRWSLDAGEWIFERCSGAEGAGLLIVVRLHKPDTECFIIPLSVMSALPDGLRISSLDEAGFILYLNYDYSSDGTYSNGTKGIREFAEMTLNRSNDMAVIKAWARINGNYSPESFDYSGEPPLYMSGGAPDGEKLLENLLDAIEFLSGDIS